MKSKNDPRHQKRANLVQKMFEWDFRKEADVPEQILPILEKLEIIDEYIKESAPMWPLAQIARIDLAILRQGIWEMYYREDSLPLKVVLDESIELAKEYGGETSPSFINGVLGGVIQKHMREEV